MMGPRPVAEAHYRINARRSVYWMCDRCCCWFDSAWDDFGHDHFVNDGWLVAYLCTPCQFKRCIEHAIGTDRFEARLLGITLSQAVWHWLRR